MGANGTSSLARGMVGRNAHTICRAICVGAVLVTTWAANPARVANAGYMGGNLRVVGQTPAPQVGKDMTAQLEKPHPKKETHIVSQTTHIVSHSTWRVVGSKILREEGVYSPENLALLLTCINKESSGNPSARNGQHVGLLQFNSNWGSEEKRLDPEWSIRRWARVLREAGVNGIRRHWCQWW